MIRPVSRNQSQESKTIWEGVSRAAKSAPGWVQPKIRKAAKDSAILVATKHSKNKK